MSFRILAENGDAIVSEDSLYTLVYQGGAGAVTYLLLGFSDEQVFGGYFGGRLRGTTVSCAGDNANKVKPCC